MPERAIYQQRRAAGLCLYCGTEPVGEGSTPLRCADCAERARQAARAYTERHRERLQERRTGDGGQNAKLREQSAARRETGLCTRCGAGLPPDSARPLCASCHAEQAVRSAGHRQRERDKNSGLTNTPPRPAGRAVGRLAGGSHRINLGLDRPAITALSVLLQNRPRNRSKEGITVPAVSPSGVVREVVRAYANHDCPARRLPHLLVLESLTILLDAQTWAILEHNANARFDGNKAECLRTMLAFTLNKPWVGATGGPRRPFSPDEHTADW